MIQENSLAGHEKPSTPFANRGHLSIPSDDQSMDGLAEIQDHRLPQQVLRAGNGIQKQPLPRRRNLLGSSNLGSPGKLEVGGSCLQMLVTHDFTPVGQVSSAIAFLGQHVLVNVLAPLAQARGWARLDTQLAKAGMNRARTLWAAATLPLQLNISWSDPGGFANDWAPMSSKEVHEIRARISSLAGFEDAVEPHQRSAPSPEAEAVLANANHIKALSRLRNAPVSAAQQLEGEVVASRGLQEFLEVLYELLANEALHVLQAPNPRAECRDGIEEVGHRLCIWVGEALAGLI